MDIGFESGLFRCIADTAPAGIDADVLARKLDVDARYVHVWCRAAYAHELLEWDAEVGYSLTPHLETLLLHSTDRSTWAAVFSCMLPYTRTFAPSPPIYGMARSGRAISTIPGSSKRLRRGPNPIASSSPSRCCLRCPRPSPQLEQGGTLLDIGAGGGYHVVHYARRFPKTQVIGLEVDVASVALARRTVAEARSSATTSLFAMAMPINSPMNTVYDLITLSIALHETGGPAEYRNVLCRVHRALKPGGMVLVSELPYPNSVPSLSCRIRSTKH